MTTDTQKDLLAQINADYSGHGEDPFKREEMQKILRIVKVETGYMPNADLERSQVDITHPDFRAAYPQGVPGLHVVSEGVSVFYEPDNKYELWIPIYGIRPEQWGKRLGRRSRIHVTTEAFEAAFKIKPFGEENQRRLAGKVARWGQHLGEAEIGLTGKVEWAWDIPRQALPDDYKFDGTPQVIRLRATDGAAASASATVVELSDDDADAAVVAAIIGLETNQEADAAERVKNISGINGKWIEKAIENTVLKTAYESSLIGLDGSTIVAK